MGGGVPGGGLVSGIMVLPVAGLADEGGGGGVCGLERLSGADAETDVWLLWLPKRGGCTVSRGDRLSTTQACTPSRFKALMMVETEASETWCAVRPTAPKSLSCVINCLSDDLMVLLAGRASLNVVADTLKSGSASSCLCS